MKALYFETFGDTDVLKYGELPQPDYFPNSALVKIHYCALNHLDLWVRKGLPGYEIPIPHILGSDISGIVVESDDRNLLGQKVILYPGINWCRNCEFCFRGEVSLCRNYHILGYQVNGGYAEYIRVPLENIFPLPEHLTLEEGACIPLTLVTVSRMLFSQVNVKPYHSVLVMGGGSGVGIMAILLLKAIGIEPICSVGNDWKKERLFQLGIKNVINYEKESLEKRIKDITNGRGVDIVIEHIGGDVFIDALKCLKRGGIVVTCGATRGDPTKFNLRYVFVKQLKVCGSMMGSLNEFEIGLKIVKNHKIRPVIDSIFQLQDGKLAHKKMEDRNIFGKIVLKITDSLLS